LHDKSDKKKYKTDLNSIFWLRLRPQANMLEYLIKTHSVR